MQIPISDEKYVFAMCFMVTASTNGKNEEVFVSDVATAAEQGKIFKRAGHEYFKVCEVSVLTGATMEAGTWYFFEKDYIRRVIVHQEAIPAKYSRADIYPGVKVRDYDRNVLKRRVTGGQALIAMASILVPILLFVGILVKSFLLFSDAVKLLGIVGLCVMMVAVYRTAFGDRLINELVDFGMWVAGIEQKR